ncbi:MAG: hypothetical protein IE878_05585 [Epsilonproteobacteria bacterium]|nr:hypothetical protein [Campylobacterota bacterium]
MSQLSHDTHQTEPLPISANGNQSAFNDKIVELRKLKMPETKVKNADGSLVAMGLITDETNNAK